MPIRVIWDSPDKTVIRYDVEGRWTWEEYYTARREARKMLDGVDHSVHFLTNPVDPVSFNYVPPGFLSKMMTLYRYNQRKTGVSVMIGGPFIQVMTPLVVRIMPQLSGRLQVAPSLEQARSLLSENAVAHSI
jgi:hypothetical protein